MTEKWTIDSIAHALPHPDLRARFAREAYFTEISDLPRILEPWIRLVEDFEANRPRVEHLRSYYRDHGQLPAEYEAESTEGAAQYEQWKSGERQQGAA